MTNNSQKEIIFKLRLNILQKLHTEKNIPTR